MRVHRLTFSALLVAIGTLSSHLIYIPVGVAKCYPVQHTINVLSAVLLGPWYAVLNAFVISLLRNMLGTGSLMAFPGSMVGALLAGVIYKRARNQLHAVMGEIFGTGILGGLMAYPIAKFVLGKDVAALFFCCAFSGEYLWWQSFSLFNP
jgi:energy coupling factor transporter S component ThiW